MTSHTLGSGFPHVLVVDHDADTREVYAFALVRSGFRVSIAVSVTDALAKARLLKPDIITTDLHGGPLECSELTRNLKASAETRAIPVIAVTGWVKTDDLERALRAGCDSVLPKPCRPDELLAEIDRLLPARWRRCPECHLRNGTSLQLSVDLPDHYFECHNCGHVWKAAPTV